MTVLINDYKRLDKPTYFISKKVGMAIAEYDMLHDGDKVLVSAPSYGIIYSWGIFIILYIGVCWIWLEH